ncbi:hypothetical protein DL96DRAFT_1639704 [Flagelloscypha sp. PMI_526]|nr:hypothetical protein DL96DRAFT_1639704 [Flagelloscypha sp. PMI_526]
MWRASAICSCGRWLALLCGDELQIWSLATPTIVLMTSLRVDLIEGANDLWINWIYSSEDRMLIIVLQTALPEIHRHIVCELSVKPRPTLRLRGSLQTPVSTYTPVDLPDNPLLLVDMVADRAQVWYPDTGRLIPIDEGQILPGYVMKRRGVIVRFGDNETSMTVTRLPLLPASMASTSSSSPTTNLSLSQIQPTYQFDYEEEIRSFEPTHGTLLLIDRSKIYISRDPSEPLFRWVVLTRYGGVASDEDASDERAITTEVHPIVFWHKGLYVNEETGESRLETLAIDEAREGIFPTSYLPSRPILDFGDEWFLWWPEASVVPDVDDGDEKPGVRIALYLFSSNGENATGGDERKKNDAGRFLKVGNVSAFGDFAEKVIEFDPISGRCVCFDGAQVVVFEFI